MDTITQLPDPAEASFDIVARQDAAEADIAALQSDVVEVKARVDRIAVAAQRPALASSTTVATPEVKGFVDGYLRRGSTLELKSIVGTVPADGGYAVPREIDALIARQLTAISPIRAIAQVVQTGSAGYRKLVTTGGTASGWVSETAARPETDTPDFAEIAPPSGELYANPAASQAMLDDAGFDLEGWLASEIAMEFARAEGAAFVTGNGVNKPKGFLAAPISAVGDTTRPFGTLQYRGSGSAAGFGANPDEKLTPTDARTPRLDLPYLFPGQAQKEAFVNEALTRLDAMVQASVVGERDLPPGEPENGSSYIVGSAPVGAWAGQARSLATWAANQWLFSSPCEGACVFDLSTGSEARFTSVTGWTRQAAPNLPTGGVTADAEARAAIAAVIARLCAAGIFSA